MQAAGAEGSAVGRSAVDRLDALGTLLAGQPEVGGVERRDPGTLVGAQAPELWVYTTPPGLEPVQAAIATLASTLALAVRTTAEVHLDDDWRESWKQFYPPLVLGSGALLLRPSWIPRRDDDPAREIVIDPGRAFGTGLHESTRLCLDRLCTLWAAGERPTTALDLGCGSGILSLAMARLFPEVTVRAVDFDPEAVQTAVENVELNGLGDRIEVLESTAQQVSPPAVPLLVANIRPEVLIPAAEALAAKVEPGGRVLLSGILVEEATAVREAYERAGMLATELPDGPAVLGEWQAVELRAP
ncbi:MAG: 50S ribosomal protein L11 methyltransferase [Nannocystaceae bacterium]